MQQNRKGMKKMARTRNEISMNDKILKAKEKYEKTKQRFDEAAKELDELMEKQRAIELKELMKAVEKSGKTYAEILAFLENNE